MGYIKKYSNWRRINESVVSDESTFKKIHMLRSKNLTIDPEKTDMSSVQDLIKIVKDNLTALGYSVQSSENTYDADLISQIKKFQEKNRLPSTGKLDVLTFNTIVKEIKNTDGSIIVYCGNASSYAYSIIFGGLNFPGSKMKECAKGILDDRNIIYCNRDKSVAEAWSFLKKFVPGVSIKAVIGFSASGSIIEPLITGEEGRKFLMVGLIDPYLRKQYSSFPTNVKMISNNAVWSSQYPENQKILKAMEETPRQDGTAGEKLSTRVNDQHGKIPAIFFEKYKEYI
jgi:hypothetical protein